MLIALVRHPAPLIRAGICYGRTDVPLHPSGQSQLPAMAARLAGFAGDVVSSPALRCRLTAEAIAAQRGVVPVFDDRLQELDFGSWERVDWNDVPRAELDRWAAAPTIFAAPGGETGAALIARVAEFHAELVREGANRVIVSHGGPLRVLAALLRGAPIDLLATPPALGSVEIFDV